MVRVIAIGGRLLALFLVFLVIALIIFFFFWQITVAPGRGLGLMRLSFDKEGGSVALFGSIAASAASYRGFSYRIKEDTLLITVWAGMINSFYR